MIPCTLVLKLGLVIFSVYNGYWLWGRPSFEDLRTATARCTTRTSKPSVTSMPVREIKILFHRTTVVPLPQHHEEPAMEDLVTMTAHGPRRTVNPALDPRSAPG